MTQPEAVNIFADEYCPQTRTMLGVSTALSRFNIPACWFEHVMVKTAPVLGFSYRSGTSQNNLSEEGDTARCLIHHAAFA